MASNAEIPLHVYQVLEEEYLSLHGQLPEEDTIRLPHERSAGLFRLTKARRDWSFRRGHIKDPISLAVKLLALRPHDSPATSPSDDDAAQLRSMRDVSGKGASQAREPDALAVYLRDKISRDTLQRVYTRVLPYAADLNPLFDAPQQQQQQLPQTPPPASNAEASPTPTAPPATPPDAKRDATATTSNIEAAGEALRELEEKLNQVLADPELYDPERFRTVTFGYATSGMIELGTHGRGVNFRGEELKHFNRLLLEEAYPNELEQIHKIRLAAIQQHLHRQHRSALCLSGGGIRSGTFALGLIQGLARHNLLGQFDYLSTVSGGGYIGGWLTAWLYRHPEGLAGVTDDLRNTPPQTKIDPDPDPLRHLRNYSNFITPTVGLLTADTWAFVAIYLRNLLLNWCVLIPLLLAVLMLPRFFVSVLLARIAPSTLFLDALTGMLPAQVTVERLLLAPGYFLTALSIAYITYNRPYVREQLRARSPFWYRRTAQRSFLLWCLLPLTGAAFFLTTYWFWSHLVGDGRKAPVLPYLVFGTSLSFFGWLIANVILRRFRPSNWREISPYELLSLLAAGFLGGFFFWLVEHLDLPTGNVFGESPSSWVAEFYACLAVPSFLAVVLLAMTFFIGLSSHLKLFTDEDREWWARAGAWILIVILAWVAFSALVIFAPLGLLASPKILTSLGGASGLLAMLAGRSAKANAKQGQAAQGSIVSSLMGSLLPLLAMLFLAIFLAALSLVTSQIIRGLAAAVASQGAAPGFWPRLLFTTDIIIITDDNLSGRLAHLWTVHYASVWLVLGLMLGLLGFGLLMSRLINLNRFSLHAGYRDRLIRGFLGASRSATERKPNPFTGFDPADNLRMHELRPALLHEADFKDLGSFAARLKLAADDEAHAQADPVSAHLYEKRLSTQTKEELGSFSGDALPSQALKVALIEDLNRALEDEECPLYTEAAFKSLTLTPRAQRTQTALSASRRSEYHILLNRLLLEQAYPREIKRSPYPPPPYKLMHVINTALNLVGGDNLAWQQRKAEPFSVSPLHAGCFRLGYRRARHYGGDDGISIGTAVAISGAAASSNMGYYTTSPAFSMMLTLFNVRLGWWLGNPGPAGDKTFRRQSPIFSISPVLSEAFGMTDDKNKYVYLTDGGHFENLALYEMVLRRCRLIVLSDGAADENYEFNDLGNAVRKIRIDLGVPIEFKDVPITGTPPATGEGGYWAIGQIRYSCVDEGAEDGVLLYIKPAVYGRREPQDVLHYKKSHATFPHESTADQFFDEPQFESYRMLGSYIMDEICGEGTDDLDLQTTVAHLYTHTTRTWPQINAAWLKKG